MAKKILGYIKLQVKAGSATPSPPIGPALGQRGVNIMGFCKEFNARTENVAKGYAPAHRDHRLSGQVVHLRHQDPPGHLLPEGSHGPDVRRQADRP